MAVTPIWHGLMQAGARGDPLANLANTAKVLRLDPDFQDLFWFDEMLRRPIMSRVTPGLIDDMKLTMVQELLQVKGLKKVSLATLADAILLVSQEHLHHPVKEKLAAALWDGDRRVHRWMHDYLGAELNDYTETVGTCFFISIIARIYQPGCKVDYMPVLEGPQGEEKSKAVRGLALGYYSDSLPDLDDDPIRVSQHLNGKLIIEVSDLSSFGKAETTKLKAFVTRQTEIYTPKYGRYEVHEPRQCVLVGTTNKAVYLKDETGARRFWPVKCGAIDLAGLERVVMQLYAEAKALYEAKEPWWPSRQFELQTIKPVQDERYEHDVWADKIAAEFAHPKPGDFATIGIIAKDILGLELGRVGTNDQRRITSCLEMLGWTKGPRQSYGQPWYPPGAKRSP